MSNQNQSQRQCPLCGEFVEIYADYVWCEECQHGWASEDFYNEAEEDEFDEGEI